MELSVKFIVAIHLVIQEGLIMSSISTRKCLDRLIRSIGLVFLNPTSQLRQVNVIAFCMQLTNTDIVKRGGATLV